MTIEFHCEGGHWKPIVKPDMIYHLAAAAMFDGAVVRVLPKPLEPTLYGRVVVGLTTDMSLVSYGDESKIQSAREEIEAWHSDTRGDILSATGELSDSITAAFTANTDSGNELRSLYSLYQDSCYLKIPNAIHHKAFVIGGVTKWCGKFPGIFEHGNVPDGLTEHTPYARKLAGYSDYFDLHPAITYELFFRWAYDHSRNFSPQALEKLTKCVDITNDKAGEIELDDWLHTSIGGKGRVVSTPSVSRLFYRKQG